MAKIALVGSYPPPYGGVSVYIKRLSNYLTTIGFDHKCYSSGSNLRKSKIRVEDNIMYINQSRLWLIKYLLVPREQLIHLNKMTASHFLIFGLLRKYRNIKLIINRHGEHLYGSISKNSSCWKDRFKMACFNYGFRNADHIIIVNEKMRPEINHLGVSNNLISWIPAFIPPSVSMTQVRLQKSVEDFITARKYIIAANGSVIFHKGQDLYGIDLLIALIERIVDPEIGLVIYLRPRDKMLHQEKMHYQFLKSKINDVNLENRVLLYEQYDEEFWPLLSKSHIYIRPTLTDGDSVSVREALFFGAKTICSDVTQRPEGVTLFKNRDIDDLTNAVILALDDVKNGRINKSLDSNQDFLYAHQILKLYKEILQ